MYAGTAPGFHENIQPYKCTFPRKYFFQPHSSNSWLIGIQVKTFIVAFYVISVNKALKELKLCLKIYEGGTICHWNRWAETVTSMSINWDNLGSLQRNRNTAWRTRQRGHLRVPVILNHTRPPLTFLVPRPYTKHRLLCTQCRTKLSD